MNCVLKVHIVAQAFVDMVRLVDVDESLDELDLYCFLWDSGLLAFFRILDVQVYHG